MLEEENEKSWKTEKLSFKKQKIVFLGGCEHTFFCKNNTSKKIGKHYLCSEGKKRSSSLTLSVFLENGTFFVTI